MRYFVTIDGVEHAVEVSELPGGSYDVRLLQAGTDSAAEGRPVAAELVAADPLTLKLGDRVMDLVVDGELPELRVFASGRRTAVRVESARMRATASLRGGAKAQGNGVLKSPMPGRVVKVLVAEGDSVTPGTPLVVVEAMKMENELVAESAGAVKKVYVQPGDAVEGGAQLVAIG